MGKGMPGRTWEAWLWRVPRCGGGLRGPEGQAKGLSFQFLGGGQHRAIFGRNMQGLAVL